MLSLVLGLCDLSKDVLNRFFYFCSVLVWFFEKRMWFGSEWVEKNAVRFGYYSYVEVNERTKLPDVPSLIADRRHSLFGHICRLLENTSASQALQLSIEAHTSTPPTTDWKHPPGRPWRNWLQQVEEDIGLSVGAARIVRCGGRYDPQLVKRSSEWVSNSWVVILQQILQRNWLRWLMSLTTMTASE